MKKEIEELSQLIFSKSLKESTCFTDESKGNLSFYRDNFFLGHLSPLESYFVVTKILLEEDNFYYFSREYIYENLPTSSNVNDFGEDFPSFLEKRDELDDIPFIGHLARLDWFWFAGTDPKRELILPSGVVELWSTLEQGKELVGIQIDENINEVVGIDYLDNELVLIKKGEVQ